MANLIISLDCELLWGIDHVGGNDKYTYLKKGFQNYYDWLFDKFEEHQICATFAFVGAMDLDATSLEKIVNDADGLNASYKHRIHNIIAKSQSDDRSWFDRSLIKRCHKSDINHEIASHSFTHPSFQADFMGPKEASFEYKMSYDILSKYNPNLSTFIFPENHINFLSELKYSNFNIYRSHEKNWYSNLPIKPLFHFLDQSIPATPNDVYLGKDSFENFHIPASKLVFAYDGIRKIIPDDIRYTKHIKGIENAIANNSSYHLWFHPWNMGSSKRYFRLLDKLFQEIGRKCSQGDLECKTMGDFYTDSSIYPSSEPNLINKNKTLNINTQEQF